jgi:hypothetical protein
MVQQHPDPAGLIVPGEQKAVKSHTSRSTRRSIACKSKRFSSRLTGIRGDRRLGQQVHCWIS